MLIFASRFDKKETLRVTYYYDPLGNHTIFNRVQNLRIIGHVTRL